MQSHEIAAKKFAAMLEKLALSVECEFVPFSRSRNAGEKSPSLNWKFAIKRYGRPISGLDAIDYMQGMGFCPAYQSKAPEFGRVPFGGMSIARDKAVREECETGRVSSPRIFSKGGKIAPPSAVDVLESLARDSDVLEYPCFEDWAGELGFDPDSREDEAIYRDCLAQALALRAAIGDGKLQRLRQLAQEM